MYIFQPNWFRLFTIVVLIVCFCLMYYFVINIIFLYNYLINNLKEIKTLQQAELSHCFGRQICEVAKNLSKHHFGYSHLHFFHNFYHECVHTSVWETAAVKTRMLLGTVHHHCFVFSYIEYVVNIFTFLHIINELV